jgi:hypothetical protein
MAGSSEPTGEAWQKHWTDHCIPEAAAADVTIVYAEEGRPNVG